MDKKLVEGLDFYYNENGYMVLTEKFHLEKGICCGNGCLHCPYDYINVPEEQRKFLLQKRLYEKKNLAPEKKVLTKETPRRSGDHSFFEDVFEVVSQVPKGRVTTYGAIAKYLGSGLSARMVGWAMNASHTYEKKVPAQRVVNRNGMLSGKLHFSTPTKMEELLKKDGVKVKEDTVVDFERLFWDPAVEISL